MVFVDSPFAPTEFVATGVQVAFAWVISVADSSLQVELVPPDQTIIICEPVLNTLTIVGAATGAAGTK